MEANIDSAVSNPLEKMTAGEFDEHAAKHAPTARKVIKLIAEHIDDVELGDSKKVGRTIAPFVNQAIQICLDDEVKFFDIGFVMMLALQAFSQVNVMASTAEAINWEKFVEIKLGKSRLDVTAKEVDEALIADAKSKISQVAE